MNETKNIEQKVKEIRNKILLGGLILLMGAYSTGCAIFPQNNHKYVKIESPGGVIRYVVDPLENISPSDIPRGYSVTQSAPDKTTTVRNPHY